MRVHSLDGLCFQGTVEKKKVQIKNKEENWRYYAKLFLKGSTWQLSDFQDTRVSDEGASLVLGSVPCSGLPFQNAGCGMLPQQIGPLQFEKPMIMGPRPDHDYDPRNVRRSRIMKLEEMRFLRTAGKLSLADRARLVCASDRLAMLALLFASGIRSCLYLFLDDLPSRARYTLLAMCLDAPGK